MNDPIARRGFLTQLAAAGLATGLVPSSLEAASRLVSDEPFTVEPQDDDAKVFAAARKRFLFPTNVTYCNTGTLGAIPRDVMDVFVKGLQQLEHELPDWPYYQADGEPLTGYQTLTAARTEVGAFIGAPADEIAFTLNATMGMSFIANGLELAAGDEVLSTNQEHTGGIGGWRLRAKRHGVVVKELPLADALEKGPDGVMKMFADAITPKTRVIVFSHITSSRGIRLPAKALCALARERGVLSVVDGAQALGQIRVNVKDLDCDAYVASPHKWLLAPKGTGVLYVKRDVQPRVWNTLASGGFDDAEAGAFRFMHYGTGSPATVWGLLAALRFLDKIGIDRVERWDTMLSTRLRDGLSRLPHATFLSPHDPRFAAGITSFGVTGKTGREVQDALWAKKIRVRAQGAAGVRLSAHLYVSPADIDRTLDVIGSLR